MSENCRSIRVQAPANIALVKYMGKSEARQNLPLNPSLSMTLKHSRTIVEISAEYHGNDTSFTWMNSAPDFFNEPGVTLQVPELSGNGLNKVLSHCKQVTSAMPTLGRDFAHDFFPGAKLKIRSANTFPTGAGIASSASSFAAITLGVAAALTKNSKQFWSLWNTNQNFRNRLAALSRQGSGSSCRSLSGPWMAWGAEITNSGDLHSSDVHLAETSLPAMLDFVIVVNSQQKKIPSSQAHLRVTTSPLYADRKERAESRMKFLKRAIATNDIKSISKISWDEMWEMHSLFHTSETPFSYFETGTIEVLNWIEPYLSEKTPPIVTLDAGPNVHILIPVTERLVWEDRLQALKHFKIIADEQGNGAGPL